MADRAALAISGACLVHCLAVPVIFALMPTIATFVRLPESLHLWLVVIAAPISGYALLVGRVGYGNCRPLTFATVGLVLLIVGATAAEAALETLATIAGGLLLAAAHVLNWRCRHG